MLLYTMCPFVVTRHLPCRERLRQLPTTAHAYVLLYLPLAAQDNAATCFRLRLVHIVGADAHISPLGAFILRGNRVDEGIDPYKPHFDAADNPGGQIMPAQTSKVKTVGHFYACLYFLLVRDMILTVKQTSIYALGVRE